MTGFLLDTNVISELRRPRPDPAVSGFVAAQIEDELFISEVTFAEIRFGIERLDDPEKRAEITAWLASSLRPLFQGRTLPISEDVILRWRLMIEAGRRRGHTFSQLDLFIAAIAAHHNLIVVTRDVTHFAVAAVPVFNPWGGEFVDRTSKVHVIEQVDTLGLLETLMAFDRSAAKK